MSEKQEHGEELNRTAPESLKPVCSGTSGKKGFDFVPVLLLFLSAGLVLMLHFWVNGDLKKVTEPSLYNSYTRQAMAWREGLDHLPEEPVWNYERDRLDPPVQIRHLELAIYNDKLYVSFPPVPSVVEFVLTFFFGMDTPDNLLMLIYISLSCEALYFAFKKRGISRKSSALFAYFICFGCCILPLCIEGAVWYHAQMLAFLCMALCLFFFVYDHPTPALIFYALSVGCRPLNAVYGLVFGIIYLMKLIRDGLDIKKICLKLLPGICAGLFIAVLYGTYNYIRFGNIFEFGHNYLHEFSDEGGVQFSLEHVEKNVKTFILGLPVKAYRLRDSQSWREVIVPDIEQWGFSMFIACPALLIMLARSVIDALRKRFSLAKGLILAGFAVQLFLLLLHRTFGGYQFGARYACDLLIYPAAYICLRTVPSGKRMSPVETVNISNVEIVLYSAALVFTVYGTLVMHI